VVKRLFNFLLEEGVIAENPAARLKTPKLKRGESKSAGFRFKS
jgi:site-specific recombinase XerD